MLLLVGVKIEAHKPTEGYGGKSLVYPVRSGTDATYLEPSQIAMYMTPHVRRIAVLLSRVPEAAVVAIKSPAGFDYHEYSARLEAVLEEENIATFVDTTGLKPRRRIPSIALPLSSRIGTSTKKRTSGGCTSSSGTRRLPPSNRAGEVPPPSRRAVRRLCRACSRAGTRRRRRCDSESCGRA